MNADLEESLYQQYPEILADYMVDGACLYSGFRCDDGWFEIVAELLSHIQYLTDSTGARIYAHQIKEKFGELRFLHRVEKEGSAEHEHRLLLGIEELARRKSLQTCEITGEPGALCVKDGYFKTLSESECERLGFEVATASPGEEKRPHMRTLLTYRATGKIIN